MCFLILIGIQTVGRIATPGQAEPRRRLAIHVRAWKVVLALNLFAFVSSLHPTQLTAQTQTSAGTNSRQGDGAATMRVESGPLKPDQSIYVPMRDGVRLAVDVYLPRDRKPNAKFPAIFVDTRYGRRSEGPNRRPSFFLAKGYAMVIVDARGTGASFGYRPIELFSGEVDDMREMIDWIAKQPWSDGNVAVTGVSYSADSGDLATTTGAAPLKAAFFRSSEIDPYLQLLNPGGVRNDVMFREWNEVVATFDLGLECLNDKSKCVSTRGVAPVAEDTGYELVRAALREHLMNGSPEDLLNIIFRDDRVPTGYTMIASGSAGHTPELRAAAVPTQYWASWVDGGTSESALSRYLSAPNVPMQLIIEATSHAQVRAADPFFVAGGAPPLSLDEIYDSNLDFLNRVLKGEPIHRQIRYVVMGSGTWKTTETWPPGGIHQTVFQFDNDHRLVHGATVLPRGEDSYKVDYTATTGLRTRWSTQYGPPPDYGDRAYEDAKLLKYTSEPLPSDMELAGNPVIRLNITSDFPDVAFFAYLEDVAPDGRSTYLTEGMLRSIHRKITTEPLPYAQAGPPHSFNRADRMPLVPGEPAEVTFALFSTAALIRKGHRLQVSIGGADADTFHRYPTVGNPTWIIYRGGSMPSQITVPLRPWVP